MYIYIYEETNEITGVYYLNFTNKITRETLASHLVLSVLIFKMRLDVYYFHCDFLDYCPHLHCGKLKNNDISI